ncbi:hypothetical protein SAMD00019534_050550 [Acytostelium subglobosum LB1]|uniref:hypothetical protein n=1 Tax=Acytostelium subglobosum LB1 TaxID=1410327 RepID=UPI000644E53C|nr:hypothetical protein SAMD00019534_050550 [Acytostelium subglobosum LB1]GAM21880.1 hypothetical protein SAMD00019534_050550 [Acytostelium subglobosum LB1]|eukprot:XP_012754980.1 hypothetical protein SAMD00019534_050550 [Acytostelium subglobosum LB1]
MCASLPYGTGLVSQDNLNPNLFYVSTHQPSNNSYGHLRNACVRSLSCERVPGREGPVFIGTSDGYFLSYMFKINDSKARGTSRWYGLLFLIGEASCLVHYFGWVVSCFRSIADEMKKRANIVFERELASNTHNQMAMARRGRAAPLRSFTDLIEDPLFFSRLHVTFTQILSNCHLKYYLIQNPPPVLEAHTELIHHLKQEYIIGDRHLLQAPSSSRQHNDMHTLLTQKLNQSLGMGMGTELVESLGQVSRIIGESSTSALIYNTIIGNQVIVRGHSRPLVASLIDALKQLIPRECASICYYSETFREIWECNILGLSPNATIPLHVERDVVALIEIDYYNISEDDPEYDSFRSSPSNIDISFSGPRYPSSFGAGIETILKQNLSPQAERMHILTLKEEWINKTKAFYGLRSIIEDDKDKRLSHFLHLINCTLEKDILILMFWTCCARKWFTNIDRKMNVFVK